MIFYNWSGGMESSAMLVIDRERIRETGAIVRLADTGKYIPEFYESKQQIEQILAGDRHCPAPGPTSIPIFSRRRHDSLRETNDCSKKMKTPGDLSRI